MATEHTGAMVALVPTAAHAARLATAGGEAAGDLHLTLFYLGEAADYDERVRRQIIERLAGLVEDVLRTDYSLPVVADGFAVNAFHPDEENACVVLGVSGGDLEAIWDLAADTLDELEAETGDFEMPEQHSPWVPHVTLAFTRDTAGMVARLLDRVGPVAFDRLRVAFAGEHTDIPLRASTAKRRRRNGYNPHQPRDPGGENGGQWVSSGGASAAAPKVNGTLIAKGAGHVGSAAAKAAELGFFGVRSWEEFKLAIQGVRTVPAPAVAAKIAAGKAALGVASGAIDAYEVGKYWNDDWAKVTFATIGAGLTVASVAAPPAAPFLLGAGLGLEALSHSKRVNEAVGDFTAPGWEWIDKQVVKPAAKLPSKLMNGKSPKPRKVAPAAVNAASGS